MKEYMERISHFMKSFNTEICNDLYLTFLRCPKTIKGRSSFRLSVILRQSPYYDRSCYD